MTVCQDNIAQIKQDSIKIGEALRQTPEPKRRPSVQRERSSDNVRPDLGVARRHSWGRQYNVEPEHGVTTSTLYARSARDVHRDTLGDSHSIHARDTRDPLPNTPADSSISFGDRGQRARQDNQRDSDDEN
jgi:hypothetical protein